MEHDQQLAFPEQKIELNMNADITLSLIKHLKTKNVELNQLRNLEKAFSS